MGPPPNNGKPARHGHHMPAGPSEVLVVADSGADPVFVASDLAGTGRARPDSQVVLLTRILNDFEDRVGDDGSTGETA